MFETILLLQAVFQDPTIQQTTEAVVGTTAGVGLLDQLSFNWLVVLLQQYMKKSNLRAFSWIDDQRDNINRLTSAILASLTAIGVSVAYDPALAGGTLTITGLSLTVIGNGLWDILKNYLGQKVIFKLAYASASKSS